jgi:glyoxalase family protein
MAIRGLHAVRLLVRDLKPMAAVLTQVLGFEEVREYPARGYTARPVTVYAPGSGGPGTEVHVESGPHLPPNLLGRGGVHHVAFRTPNDEEHQAWRQRISNMGLNVTPVIDRFYFKSIYFQVPEGILFEIATDGPGFAADEDMDHLGERLALPPFLEPHRERIEAGLHPLEVGGR